jgi:hypothetical protein
MSRAVPAEVADMGCVHVGDDIVFLGRPHRIVSITQHVHPELGDYEMAHDEHGWTIALHPHSARCAFGSSIQQLALPA